ncbi:hypothetical protein ACUBJ7_17610 [Klebsiella pneumoniae]|uniref:hypothetical protein n=1 Tax=Klebsiella pneumoniae complex TaxID=3390273 RepID=UPI00081BE3D6|nr:hypothetical protein [Klebsiella pneumoniae]MCD7986786.1 hypothetical protein [Klebsiella quasipneumoniae]HDS4085194.1 hypothetical protein [Klebsiella pneumoniae subsp. pneumoniae]MCD5916953.1 hypothetical protein [Klebsiella pneumoniae]MDF9924267.1 hypothetical protein [Klebsiella pneumoniae]MDR4589769.1 hypothetical protein [Klebsiella pneumoniae]
MGRQTHVGYHNCRNEGGKEFLKSSVPFLSGDGDNQWLTQGYYFWTDSPYWAERWNPGRDVAISEFKITFHTDDELLDLVGNAGHIFEFQKMRLKVAQHLDAKDVSKVTVSQVIDFLRALERDGQPGIFPYLAVKAQDYARASDILKMFFIRRGKGEHLACLTRQQLCVFEQGRDRIYFQGFVAPADYKE